MKTTSLASILFACCALGAAAAVRCAIRVWSRKSVPSSPVNSMSCMSR